MRDNVARVRERIAEGCQRVGREAAEVRLVGVTKYTSLEVLREFVAAGLREIGENQVQQLSARATECGPTAFGWPEGKDACPAEGPRWHMLGHLQRNKVKTLLRWSRIVHSLDSARLAETIDRHAEAQDVCVDAFLEVNVSGEATKEGVGPEALEELVAAVAACRRVCLRGLMTIPPYASDPEASRPYYARLRELLERLRERGLVAPTCAHLSMGMSQDYVVAVEEGATFLRVGSALCEGLPATDPRRA